MSVRRLVRDQHPSFGTEIRALLCSKVQSDEDLSGELIKELDDLAERKAVGQRHRWEDTLDGDLREIGYLRIYRRGRSVRIYFTVIEGRLWMLLLDANKRTRGLAQGQRDQLGERLRWVKQRQGAKKP